MKFNLTRIAPSPSGYLHIGNAFSFLLTQAIAEQSGAKILLRIDDMDRDRFRMEYLVDIFETLDFLKIPIDLGPKNPEDFLLNWTQRNRMEHYQQALEKLWASGQVFSCTCSRKKISQMNASGYYLGHCLDRAIPKMRKEAAWRFNTLQEDLTEIQTISGAISRNYLAEDTAFFIVRKKDQLPAYQLTSLIDDLEYGVDLIVRGEDLFQSSLAQLTLAKALRADAFQKIRFHHHVLLKNPDGSKISKSDGATSVLAFRQSGKTLVDLYKGLGQRLGIPTAVENFEDFKKCLPALGIPIS